jgi:drug/metabolite transporter (DMT)-like permease
MDPERGGRLADHPAFEAALAWYFVLVWGSGYVATKTGIQYAPPFTFLALRFAFGVAILVPVLAFLKPRWPAGFREWCHVVVAGLLVHAANLGGSHYAQYLGLSAGVTALLLGTQPLVTAAISSRYLGEQLHARQWAGVVIGLAGVALVVWHRIDARAMSGASLAAIAISLAAITAGTLYQRAFCPRIDLRSSALIQLAASFVVLAPLAWGVEGFPIRWSLALVLSIAYLVIFSSILAVSVLHTLMRRGHATRVTSILYLTPIVAVACEWSLFGVVPSPLTAVGIAVTCAGVALVTRRPARAAQAGFGPK